MFYDDDGNEGTSTTEGKPVLLVQPFLNEGRILFTDNFYTLAEHLLDNNTHLCGAV